MGKDAPKLPTYRLGNVYAGVEERVRVPKGDRGHNIEMASDEAKDLIGKVLKPAVRHQSPVVGGSGVGFIVCVSRP